MKYPRGRMVLFARTPQVGRVKTRLAADMDDEAAFQLYCAMLEYTLRTAKQAGIAEVVLYVYPDIDAAFFSELCDRYSVRLYRQDGRDLGERMASAMIEQLKESDFVILIGADCLLIDESYLKRTTNKLAGGTSLVFGPADDGGYVMVAMTNPHVEIFETINWGTAEVMAQSRDRCRQHGLSMEEMPVLFDIDTVLDWERLQRDYPAIENQLNQLVRQNSNAMKRLVS